MTLFFFFKQKTAYEMRISDWSSDVCSSDLASGETALRGALRLKLRRQWHLEVGADHAANGQDGNFSYRVNGVEISVPGAASRVEEQRDGVFAGATWTPDPSWTAEAALRRETPVLRNRAGPGQAARFGDFLPRVAATLRTE